MAEAAAWCQRQLAATYVGRVVSLMPTYGFIAPNLFFHRTNFRGNWYDLRAGDYVQFVEFFNHERAKMNAIHVVKVNPGTPNAVPNPRRERQSTPVRSVVTAIGSVLVQIDDRDHQQLPGTVSAPQVTQPVLQPALPAPQVTRPPKNEWVEMVTMMFPDADVDYIKDQLTKSSTQPDPVNIVCNHLIETEKTYPRKAKVVFKPAPKTVETVHETTVSCTPTADNPVKQNLRDYLDYSAEMSEEYQVQCLEFIKYEFIYVPTGIIRTAADYFNHHYVPLKQCLMETMRNAKRYKGKGHFESACIKLPGRAPVKFKPLKGFRRTVLSTSVDPDLRQELAFMEKQQVQTQLSEDPSQLYECGCCYGEFSIAGMVQCNDGHLFCSQCVESYVREAVFGQGRVDIHCMTGDCTASFRHSDLQKHLPPSLLEQFDDRLLTENINLADITDLVRCPAPDCDFAAIMDPNDKVFRCQNSACLKETCRYCEVDWSEHIGIPCREIEKKAEVNIRLTYEEKMTEAKIRTCVRCKAKFFKDEGCNKMTCRCGYTMCYICREPGIDYKHFCQHPLDPGKSCTQCKSCLLWTNPEADERRALAELQQEAQSERKNKGYEAAKKIG